MKSEYWILLGIAGYWLYSRSQSTQYGSGGLLGSSGSTIYPGGASRSTGSGGTTASGSGISGGSFTNPPVSGTPGNPAWSNPDGYITCPDGTLVNDPSLCPVTDANYITCIDDTQVNDASLCPENQGYVDSGDPCDPNSAAYDISQCGSPAGYL